jgi:hypothetical protein
MARVGEFCSANIAKLLLSVFIVVALLVGVGIWVFYSPGRTAPIVQPSPPKPTE